MSAMTLAFIAATITRPLSLGGGIVWLAAALMMGKGARRPLGVIILGLLLALVACNIAMATIPTR